MVETNIDLVQKKLQDTIAWMDIVLAHLNEIKSIRSPLDKLPVSNIILFGSVVTNESYGLSDIDLCVTFPIEFSSESDLPMKYQFPHLGIGYQIRHDFKQKWKADHLGTLPPWKLDLTPFPDPRCVPQKYFDSRPIWKSIINNGILLWSEDDNYKK